MSRSDVERKVELSWLLAFYEGVLTEKQKQFLRKRRAH